MDIVFRLLQSLYGLKQTSKYFFDKISEGLIERGFDQSKLDKYLCTEKDMICGMYVDATILADPDVKALETVITNLGIAEDEQRHTFELYDKDEAGDLLGIRIEKTDTKEFTLTKVD